MKHVRPPFDANAHHARMLECAASSRRQIMTGRTIFDRDFLIRQARNCIDGARDVRKSTKRGLQ